MKQQLIEDNMNLVYFVINKYYPTFRHDEDLIQTAMVGLCQAADIWNEKRGAFSTFATRLILSRIQDEFRYRKKHSNQYSLDYMVSSKDEDAVCFGDLLAGQSDIDWIDVDEVRRNLTDTEQKVFDMKLSGVDKSEIAEQIGCSQQLVNKKLRKIKRMLEDKR